MYSISSKYDQLYFCFAIIPTFGLHKTMKFIHQMRKMNFWKHLEWFKINLLVTTWGGNWIVISLIWGAVCLWYSVAVWETFWGTDSQHNTTDYSISKLLVSILVAVFFSEAMQMKIMAAFIQHLVCRIPPQVSDSYLAWLGSGRSERLHGLPQVIHLDETGMENGIRTLDKVMYFSMTYCTHI